MFNKSVDYSVNADSGIFSFACKVGSRVGQVAEEMLG